MENRFENDTVIHKKIPLILVGGGGHCKSCIEVIEATKRFEIIGILDKEIGGDVLGYPIIGNDDLIPDLATKGYQFLITLGQIKSPDLRIKLFQFIKNSGGELATITAPTATVSKRANIGEGTIVMHGVFVNVEAKIGNNCTINTRSIIEHDVQIGNNCHISTNVTLNGEVIIGDNCFVGSGSVFHQCVEVCSDVIISANSLIHKSISVSGVYLGNPLRKFK